MPDVVSEHAALAKVKSVLERVSEKRLSHSLRSHESVAGVLVPGDTVPLLYEDVEDTDLRVLEISDSSDSEIVSLRLGDRTADLADRIRRIR